MKTGALALILAACGNAASGQVLDWLPISDLPLTSYEANGNQVIPAVASMCMWDPDGDGPKSKSVVVAGSLNFAGAAGSTDLAYFDEDGWVPVVSPGGAYTIMAYRSPLAAREELYYATNSDLYRRDGNAWTHLRAIDFPKTMNVLDLDGPGPQPPKLFVSSSNLVYSYDGTTFTQLGGSAGSDSVYSIFAWDIDGTGQLTLLAGGRQGIAKWNGSQWVLFAPISGQGNVWSLCSFDFDGAGPGAPELVVSGSFSTLGGVATGPLAVRRNGTWVGLGVSYSTTTTLYRATSFDPDGPGPMNPLLVVAGRFATIGGISATNIAYYDQGTWGTFPQHWNASSVCLGVNDAAAYSDSPQLVVGALAGIRPAVGFVALCDTAPGYRNDPAGGRRPAGENLSLGVIPTGDELSFRWFKGTTPVMSGTTASGSVISGAASPRLTISGLTPQDEGEYHVVIGNAFGSVTTQNARVSLGCAADFNADDVVDFSDYLDFVSAFVSSDPVSDFNVDLQFDLFDYLDFVQHMSDGC